MVVAAAIWGRRWAGYCVTSACDNQAVVSVLNSRHCREPDMMQLLRCLFFLEAYFQFHLSAAYLPGVANDLADDLSRDRLAAFLSKKPEADRDPSNIPPLFYSGCYTPASTGHLQSGLSSSVLLLQGHSRIHPQNLPVGPKALWSLLFSVLSYIVSRGSKEGPFFLFSDGRPLTKPKFTDHIQEALTFCRSLGGSLFLGG